MMTNFHNPHGHRRREKDGLHQTLGLLQRAIGLVLYRDLASGSSCAAQRPGRHDAQSRLGHHGECVAVPSFISDYRRTNLNGGLATATAVPHFRSSRRGRLSARNAFDTTTG